jgi:hypothetical protein
LSKTKSTDMGIFNKEILCKPNFVIDQCVPNIMKIDRKICR